MSKAVNVGQLLRPGLSTIGQYDFAARWKHMEAAPVIRMMANENPYGCSPRLLKALATYPDLHLYTDPAQRELRELLAGYTCIGAEYIVASHGSEELIDYAMRLFIGPGDEVIDAIPSFSNFRIRTQLLGGSYIQVLRNKDFSINIDAVKAAVTKNSKMIVLANPNNPTGTLTSQKDLLELLDTGLMVMVDEAYAEFSGETFTQLVKQHENLMVLRTFSKWAAIAGVRLGYGIFSPKIAGYLMRIKNPGNISQVALVAVRESLKDLPYLQENVNALIAERERLFAELSKLPYLKPVPSRTNFIFCPVNKGNAKEITQKLESKGVRITAYDIPWGGTALRITVGKPEHTDALMKALQEVGQEIGL